jgi:16S rRNA C1402 N4-methylase RsmH
VDQISQILGQKCVFICRGAAIEAFHHSFSDRPAAHPAFGNRIITGVLTDLEASRVKLRLERGFRHPYYYIDFEMHERVME